jgi:hypothetical protein
MNIRKETIYLTTEVWRALWMIAKSRDDGAGNISTPDCVADKLLREAITKHYPQVFQHQKQVEQLEKELLENLAKRYYLDSKLVGIKKD